ncbi:uncharacterized protein LOC129601412 [Paramacrobiotus metropolitanus]|uniref:uncharacterized protein LOC129601412 n=1 Tax=Paramacrobiotus metropolitanus TaxID=2943436 RepID=UPI002445CD11|nr:uncharacterized protein LOC129601412 [Paramacrobiotus metropolitanus]
MDGVVRQDNIRKITRTGREWRERGRHQAAGAGDVAQSSPDQLCVLQTDMPEPLMTDQIKKYDVRGLAFHKELFEGGRLYEYSILVFGQSEKIQQFAKDFADVDRWMITIYNNVVVKPEDRGKSIEVDGDTLSVQIPAALFTLAQDTCKDSVSYKHLKTDFYMPPSNAMSRHVLYKKNGWRQQAPSTDRSLPHVAVWAWTAVAYCRRVEAVWVSPARS